MVKSSNSKGRQRIEMKKIQNKARLGVTFTKRRTGIFKKASELVTLCGVQLAILVFSPGKKVYSFGHPNVDSILDRFISYVKQMHGVQYVHDRLSKKQPVDEFKKTRVDTLTAQIEEVKRVVETEENIAKELKEELHNMKPMDQLNFSEKLELHGMMKELKGRISYEIQQRLMNPSCMPTKNNLSLNLGL